MLAPLLTLPEPIACPPSGAGLGIKARLSSEVVKQNKKNFYARFFLANNPPASEKNVPISSIDTGSGVGELFRTSVLIAV